MIILDNQRAMWIYEKGLKQEIEETVQEYNEGSLEYEDFCNIMADLLFQQTSLESLKGYDGCYFASWDNEEISSEQILGAKMVLEIED